MDTKLWILVLPLKSCVRENTFTGFFVDLEKPSTQLVEKTYSLK